MNPLFASAKPVVGMIHVERIHLSEQGGENRLKMTLKSASYLGERWEYLLVIGGLKVRVWGEAALAPGDYWVAVPADALWIF